MLRSEGRKNAIRTVSDGCESLAWVIALRVWANVE